MKVDTVLEALDNGEIVWDLGQLDNEAKKLLNKMVRKGIVIREKAMWPWYAYGVIRKTCYRKVRELEC